MKLRVSRLHHPVEVLGPGVRAGVWLQGCSIGCKGCMSLDTWDRDGGRIADVMEIIAWLNAIPVDELDGITISGGEPFDQPQALDTLLREISAWRSARARAIDVLCYSGYPLHRLRRLHGATLAEIDAVITGTFREELPTRLIWRGSANQVLTAITPLGRARYAAYVELEPSTPALQVTIDAEAVRFIGVPRRGDLALLEARLLADGISLGRPSWRA